MAGSHKTEHTQIEYVDPRVLIPAEYNPRKADPKDYEALKKSIERFGIEGSPIIVNSAPNRMNVIIGGHFRVRVAIDLGMQTVPVIYKCIADVKQEQEYNLRLNKNLGRWDFNLLGALDKELLIDVGFESNMLDVVFGLAEDDIDIKKEYESIIEPVTQEGDIYVMNGHRLMCGDSSKRECVKKLMGGGNAQTVYTDPPYNVNYDYWGFRGTREHGVTSKKVFSDKKTPQEYEGFLAGVFSLAFEATSDDATVYCWHASRFEYIVRHALEAAGWHNSQTLIWLKDRITLSPGQDYHRIYEPCLYGWKRGEKHKIIRQETGKFSELLTLDYERFEDLLDVIYSKRDDPKTYVHPTQKPIRIAERPLRKSTERGDIVLDLFGGSGSTLIACEQMDRRCFLMELDTKFCDVIVKRWESFTNQKAELIRHGESTPEHGRVEASAAGGS